MFKCFMLLFCASIIHAQMDIQGHRGARGNLPENTIEGMLFALDAGVQTLELDVVITKDKKVVLSHEPWMSHLISTAPDGTTLTRETEKDHNIYKLTYSEIILYDCGMKPHPWFPQQINMPAVKPLLSEVIQAVETRTKQKGFRPVFYNVEIKSTPAGDNIFHPEVSEFSDLVMKTLKKELPTERFNIQSFDTRVLQYLHDKYPEVELAYLIEEKSTGGKNLIQLIEELKFTPQIISPQYTLLHEQFMLEASMFGMKVIPWTINDEENMLKAARLGVHGIITDYPELALELFGKYNE